IEDVIKTKFKEIILNQNPDRNPNVKEGNEALWSRIEKVKDNNKNAKFEQLKNVDPENPAQTEMLEILDNNPDIKVLFDAYKEAIAENNPYNINQTGNRLALKIHKARGYKENQEDNVKWIKDMEAVN